MAPKGKVVLITGSNRGIGQGMAKAIAARPEPIHLIAASRSGQLDDSIKLANPDGSISSAKLDYTDDSSIEQLAQFVKARYGRLDVLINNGAVLPEATTGFTDANVDLTLSTNFYGPQKLTAALIALLRPGSRVVHFSSAASQQFKPGTPELDAAFNDPELTLDRLNDLVHQYQEDAKSKRADSGWLFDGFHPIYSMSKVFINILTAIQARVHPEIIFNAVCPGIVNTAMANDSNLTGMPLEKGIRVPMLVAFGDIGGVSGEFWSAPTPRDEDSPGAVNEGWMGKPLHF